MKQHSIFARQWWTVSLRGARNRRGPTDPAKQLDDLLTGIAKAIGGTVHGPGTMHRGVSVAAAETRVAESTGAKAITATLIFQSNTVYFPLAEESLEAGQVVFEEIAECERDFPRRISSGGSVLFQYPLLVTSSSLGNGKHVFSVSAPYFMLLKDIMRGLTPGSIFSACIAVDVGQVFAQLTKAVIPEGTLTVRSGRMVITGIDFLRSAVFFGDNVIASPLYSRLIEMEDVVVLAKDCRLRRSYVQPVGDSRRPFICWFDPHGNFRFTPGSASTSTLHKFLELLSVLDSLQLVVESGATNPLTKIGMMS